jgi:hypothetical protein
VDDLLEAPRERLVHVGGEVRGHNHQTFERLHPLEQEGDLLIGIAVVEVEIDLVLETDGEVWAIESELTTAPSRADLANLDRAADLIGASRRLLISQTKRVVGDDRRASGDLAWFLELLDALPVRGAQS